MALRQIFQNVLNVKSNISAQAVTLTSVKAYSSDSKFSAENLFSYLKDKFVAEKRKKFESEAASIDSVAAPPLPSDVDSAVSESAAPTSTPAPPEPKPYEAMIDPKYGYAAIGGWSVKKSENPADPKSTAAAPISTVHPRLHPRKTFYPGDTYSAQDLNPFADQVAGRTNFRKKSRPSHEEVEALVDYKNVSFLQQFLSPAGRIQPRRHTKLTRELQDKMAKSIKLARVLGLMAGEARLDKLHLTRVRQEELHQYHQRQAVEKKDTMSS
uniref:Small ribosomal subunit protein bS18c n=1 Tax=Polytomella parva TaxID=51329 RepID=A0A7S0YAM9_9CHLO|mmetsp:Transcript_1844/g.2700  ORF Transcript_1844/g.2700 Transcript_1844/m.2700 type:complete len:269 (+) Transcript_1844:49-855(+)